MTVRELVGAKRNHDCILSLIVTTSDLTGPARKEADQFKVDYWHGGLVDSKLRSWGKWTPSNRSVKTTTTKKEQSLSKTYLISNAVVVLQWLNVRIKLGRNFGDVAAILLVEKRKLSE